MRPAGDHPSLMKRHSVLIWFALAFCACLMAGRELLLRIDQDARALRACRAAEQLVAQYASFREHAAKLPPDSIVTKLMDTELLVPRAGAYRSLVDALRLEVRDSFAQIGLAEATTSPDSARIAQQMLDWEAELRRRYRCPTLAIAEEYIVRFVPTQPRARPPTPPLDEVFDAALERSTQTAAMYRESAHSDSAVLCRSRAALAKARMIHDYLQQRCANAEHSPHSALNCEAPLRRSQQQIDELHQVAALNQTKFSEKWGRWLDSGAMQCGPGQ
jgi:hypothetical protein